MSSDPIRRISAFPILDGVHLDGPDRTIVDVCGLVELFVAEVDSWCALPVRLVQTAGAGLCLELGPYQLDAAGVAVLRAAVADYDLAVSGPAA